MIIALLFAGNQWTIWVIRHRLMHGKSFIIYYVIILLSEIRWNSSSRYTHTHTRLQ